MNTVRSEMIGKHDRTDGCQCDSCGSLTFAEAMALDPSEVEFCPVPPGTFAVHWWPFETWQKYGHMDLRNGSFRRVRPRRPRVQEMAEKFREPSGGTFDDAMIQAIRAVCEYSAAEELRTGERPTHEAIERHFLEPR